MSRISGLVTIIILLMAGFSCAADQSALTNAFAQTATAYANDSFLLLGMVGDQFVAGSLDGGAAAQTVTGVQKRIRVIRAKINLVLSWANSDQDRKWLQVLDNVYICLDRQAWAARKFVDDRSPASAKRFETFRNECLDKIRNLSQFYESLANSEELPAPLSTR